MIINIRNKTNSKYWHKYYVDFDHMVYLVSKKFQLNEESSVSIILVKNRKMKEINTMYRNKNTTTDVITFASCDGDDFNSTQEIELGDIFINVDAVVEQAQRYDHSERREINFLLVHGLLHCLGYDHLTPEDEEEMFSLQKELLDPWLKR